VINRKIVNTAIGRDVVETREQKKAGLPRFWCKKKSKEVKFVNGRFNFAG